MRNMHLVRGRSSYKIGIDMSTSEAQFEHLHSCNAGRGAPPTRPTQGGCQWTAVWSRVTTYSAYLKIQPTFPPSPKWVIKVQWRYFVIFKTLDIQHCPVVCSTYLFVVWLMHPMISPLCRSSHLLSLLPVNKVCITWTVLVFHSKLRGSYDLSPCHELMITWSEKLWLGSLYCWYWSISTR